VRDLAEALGIDGDPTRQQSGWIVDDGDGRHLEVYEGGGGSWWYTPDFVYDTGGGASGSSSGSAGATDEEIKLREEAAAAEEPTTTVAVPCPPDADCASIDPPERSTPPADLPSKDEARRIALDLFRSAGLDVDDAKVTVDGPYEAWSVNVEPRVDGRTVSGYGWNASVGSKGKITSAGGTLNAPDRLGDYPVLDTREAIDRLNTQYGGYERFAAADTAVAPPQTITTLAAPTCLDDLVAGQEVSSCGAAGGPAPSDLPCSAPTTMYDPAAADVPATKPLADPDASVSSPAVAEEPAIGSECVPPEPPEPVEIVLHEAEEILVMVGAFDDSGDAYLVPGYRFHGDDGAVAEVAAVDDDSLLPQPDPVEDPGPVTTMPPEVRCAQPEPGPDGAVPEICLDPNSVPPAEPTEAPTP
jgi:hypothetical protein